MNWKLLESLPGLTAVPAVWRRQLGGDFEAFRQLCLQPESWQVESFPCPHDCGGWHRLRMKNGEWKMENEEPTSSYSCSCSCSCSVPSDSGCGSTPVGPLAFSLTLADITPLRVNRAKLAREVCRAFGLDSKFADLAIPNTFQAGAWSADAVPVLVTIQTESHDLRHTVAELALRLQRPFILLAPTTNLLTAPCDELLAHARAGFFALSSTVTLTPHGALLPSQPPGALFARFAPQPKESQDAAARQLFALAKALDSDATMKKALPSTVLRLYCVEGMRAEQIARQLRCAPSLVWARLKLLGQKLGRSPAELREYSDQFQKIESSLMDPRARQIYRKGVISEDEDAEDSAE